MPFIDVDRLDPKTPREGWTGRFFHSPNMTIAYYTVDAGAWIHEHAHPNDEIWNVIEGELEITIAGESRRLGPGAAAVVPPELPAVSPLVSQYRSTAFAVVANVNAAATAGVERIAARRTRLDWLRRIGELDLLTLLSRPLGALSAEPVFWLLAS